MAEIGLGVGYWHPRTRFRVVAEARQKVTATPEGSVLVPVVDVDLRAEVSPDPGARQLLSFHVGLLEKLDLEFSFDDQGLLESLNSESGRDITPVVSLVGKAISLATLPALGFAAVKGPSVTETLEVVWATTHKDLAALHTGLEDRTRDVLGQMVEEGASPVEVTQLGKALDVLQAQLSSLSQVRRAWIASQASTVALHEWTLHPADLVRQPGVELPAELTGPVAPTAQVDAEVMGLLIAICDDDRAAERPHPHPSTIDTVALRGSRPAQVGAYLRDESEVWKLQRDSVIDLDVVDEFSPTQTLSLDGRWRGSKRFTLAYHPDKSLKTFGLSSSPAAGSISTAVGGVADAAAATTKAWLDRPSAVARELEQAKTQLDLARTATDMEALAATQTRAAELALLEQERDLRDARK